jgi:uncharacterized MnhB-related membrane protein
MFESFLLIVLLILALFVILSDNLLRSNIYLGVFSLVMALTYLHYNAPDVALAEAAIGVGLSTVMYLVALKKITVYDICFVNEEETFNDDNIREYMPNIIRPLEIFIEKIEEIEPQISFSNRPIKEVIQKNNHDFIILKKDDNIYLYGYQSDEVYKHIQLEIDEIITDTTNIEFVYLKKGEIFDTKTNK